MDNFLRTAIDLAEKSLKEGGIPIGSVLVHKGKIEGRGYNKRVQKKSVILHAEMDALEDAGRHNAAFYKECILYTTLSPCSMCAGAVLLYGIPKVVIGEDVTFRGEKDFLISHGVEASVINDPTCISMMEGFIKRNPDLWFEDIGEQPLEK